jgi:hypothetical protein
LPEGQQLLKNLHATGILNTPAEAAVFIREDTARWKDVILKNKIVGE